MNTDYHTPSDSGILWTLETERLTIRRAEPSPPDIALLFRLWSDPMVMGNVGFPSGLGTTTESIERQLKEQGPNEFDCILIVTIKTSTESIGECRLVSPDSADTSNSAETISPASIARTDIKLVPEHWGNGYGKEIKLALLDYLFTHTSCLEVRATPNKGNIRSIRLQESVSGRLIGEGVYRFPDSLRPHTVDVPYLEYAVLRADWEKNH